MQVRKILIGAICVFAVSGCAETMDRLRTMNWMEIAGTLGGAAVGGYVGAQFGGGWAKTAFTAAGVLAGGGAGYVGARMLSQRDMALHSDTTQRALAEATPGKLHRWENPENGRSGMVRTVASYQRPDGSRCQQYRASVVFEDGVSSGNGAACQQADGTWLAFNNQFN